MKSETRINVICLLLAGGGGGFIFYRLFVPPSYFTVATGLLTGMLVFALSTMTRKKYPEKAVDAIGTLFLATAQFNGPATSDQVEILYRFLSIQPLLGHKAPIKMLKWMSSSVKFKQITNRRIEQACKIFANQSVAVKYQLAEFLHVILRCESESSSKIMTVRQICRNIELGEDYMGELLIRYRTAHSPEDIFLSKEDLFAIAPEEEFFARDRRTHEEDINNNANVVDFKKEKEVADVAAFPVVELDEVLEDMLLEERSA